MTTHQDTGQRCLVLHADGHGQCVICACGAHVRPHEWREHIGAAVESLAAKREAEAAVVEAAKTLRDSATKRQWAVANDRLEDAVDALRALEGDA
jgi:hypothetical protein